MLTNKDKKAMSLSSRKPWRFTAVLVLTVLFTVLSVVKELYLVSVYGSLAGLTLLEVIHSWLNFSLTL